MSWHKEDWADAATKVGETLSSHPEAVVVAVAFIVGFILGKFT